MDFKELVMHDADPRYQSMANGTMQIPTVKGLSVASYGEYSEKHRAYHRRLENEKNEFNNAVEKLKAKRAAVLQHEDAVKNERKAFTKCVFLLLAAIGWMLLIIDGAVTSNELTFAELLKQETSFDVFMHSEGTGAIAFYVSIGITFFIWLLGLRKAIDNLVGSIVCAGFVFLAVRAVVAVIGYVAPYIINEYGVLLVGLIATVMILVRASKFATLTRSKIKVFLLVIVTLAVAVLLYFVTVTLKAGGGLEDVKDTITAFFE